MHPDSPRPANLSGYRVAVLFKIRHDNAAVAKQAALAGAEREVAGAEVKQRLKLRLSRLSGLRNRRQLIACGCRRLQAQAREERLACSCRQDRESKAIQERASSKDQCRLLVVSARTCWQSSCAVAGVLGPRTLNESDRVPTFGRRAPIRSGVPPHALTRGRCPVGSRVPLVVRGGSSPSRRGGPSVDPCPRTEARLAAD
jgi:hypothetical protein